MTQSHHGYGEKFLYITLNDYSRAMVIFRKIINMNLNKEGKIIELFKEIDKLGQYAQKLQKESENGDLTIEDKYYLINESLKNTRLKNALEGLCVREGYSFIPHETKYETLIYKYKYK